jgi:tetratricopeptide (TPR) repeat protein
MYANLHANPMLKIPICLIIFIFMGCEGADNAPPSLHKRLLKHHSLITEGKTGAARVRLRQYMEKYGETSHPLFLMGLSFHSEKRYAKSVEWLTKSTIDPDNQYPLAWHFLGWSQFYLGDIASAQFSFEQFLQKHPEEPDSMFALGLLALERGELQEAEALFLTVIKLAPKNKMISAKATARLADVMVERDDWQHAIHGYKDALQQNPNLYEAWYRYATALKRLGKMDEAEQALAHFEEARKRVRPDLYQQTRFPE